MVSIEIATTSQEIAAIADQWLDLERRSSQTAIAFQRYHWCTHWWKIFGETEHSHKLAVGAIWRDGLLVAVVPMMVVRNWFGAGEARMLGHPLGQYANAIVDPSFSVAEAMRLTLAELSATGLADLALIDQFPAAIGFGFEKQIIQPDGVSFILDLTEFADFAAYEQSLSRNSRKGLRRKANKLGTEGMVEFELMATKNLHYPHLVDAMLGWKREALEASGRVGRNVFSDQFHTFLASLPDGSQAGGLEPVCHVMRLDAVPIAGQVMFRDGNGLIGYFSAYDPLFASFSPGRLELHRLIEWMFDNGLDSYDFLANSETYKVSLANRQVALAECRLPMTWRGRLASQVPLSSLKVHLKIILSWLPAPARRVTASIAREFYVSTTNRSRHGQTTVAATRLFEQRRP